MCAKKKQQNLCCDRRKYYYYTGSFRIGSTIQSIFTHHLSRQCSGPVPHYSTNDSWCFKDNKDKWDLIEFFPLSTADSSFLRRQPHKLHYDTLKCLIVHIRLDFNEAKLKNYNYVNTIHTIPMHELEYFALYKVKLGFNYLIFTLQFNLNTWIISMSLF